MGIVPEFDLGDRMRRALRHAGMSVQDMADYLEVSRNAVSSWINSRIQPSGATIRAWAMRTGVSYEWLKTGTPPPDGPDGGGKLLRLDSNQRPSD